MINEISSKVSLVESIFESSLKVSLPFEMFYFQENTFFSQTPPNIFKLILISNIVSLVNSLDVFVWVLITAGAILFPVACFAYFCLKRQWQIRKLEQEYLYADPAKRKNLERGFLGPYAESKENVSNDDNNKPRTSNLNPEIVVQPYNLNNKVRFKDDPDSNEAEMDQQNQLPALMTENYNPETQSVDQNQGQDLRGLKNAVNFFGKNLANNKKQNNYSNRSVTSGQQQQLPSVPNSYSQNPIQPDVPIQQVYSQSNSQRSSIQQPVYSVANSYPQQGIQANASSASNLVPDNIYSQVVPQRTSRTSSQLQLPQQDEVNYSNSQGGAYDDEQPVYMNSGDVDQYTDQYSDQFGRNSRY